MEKGPRSHRQSPVRTIAFALLAAAVLLGLALGQITPRATARTAGTGELYRRAGDMFVWMVYLAQSPQRGDTEGGAFLEKALDYYSLSTQTDPADARAMASLGLVLHEVGRTREGLIALAEAMRRPLMPEEQKGILAAVMFLSVEQPPEEQIDEAVDYLRTLAPGGIALARAYGRLEKPELVQREWDAASAQAEARLMPVLALLAVALAGMAAGAVGLIVAAVSHVRRKRVGISPGSEAAPASWGVREAVEALVIWVFLAIALQILLERAQVTLVPRGMAAMIPSLAAGIGAIGWVLLVSPRPRRLGWQWSAWWRQALAGGLVAAACAIPILALYAGIQQAYVRYMVSHQTVPGTMSQEHPLAPLFVVTQGWQAKALLAAAACLVMPVVEETLFRGILYRGFRREWAVAPAALASALVFAVGHLSVTGVVPYLWLGLLFAYLYERSGSLVAPWTAHAVFNAFNVAILMAITG